MELLNDLYIESLIHSKKSLCNSRLYGIFILFFILYLLGTRYNLGGYELEYVLSAMNVFHGKGPSMAPGFEGCPGVFYFGSGPENTTFPRQNLLQTYLSVPFYALGAVLLGEKPTIPERGLFWELPWGPLLTVAFLNPLLSAGIVVLVILISLDFGIAPPHHYRLGILTGLSTMLWPYAGIGMEVIQTFFLMLTIWIVLRFQRTGKMRYLMLAALCMILLPNCKKYSFIFLIPIFLYLISGIPNRSGFSCKMCMESFIFASVSVIGGLSICAVSLGFKMYSDPGYLEHLLEKLHSQGPPLVDMLMGLTLSPSEGLFVFNPILIFAVAGWRDFSRQYRREAILFITITVILLAALSRIPYLLIDEEWGPRYLHMLIPLLMVAGASTLLKERKGIAKFFFILILVVSIAFQMIGTLFLGYKVLDSMVAMGIPDFTATVFTPSLSQLYVTGLCFVSTIHRYVTYESLDLEHTLYKLYCGGISPEEKMTINLSTYDQPVGGLFTARWVLAEKGFNVWPESWMFIITLILMIVIAGGLFYLSRNPKSGSKDKGILPESIVEEISVSVWSE